MAPLFPVVSSVGSKVRSSGLVCRSKAWPVINERTQSFIKHSGLSLLKTLIKEFVYLHNRLYSSFVN